MELSTNKKHVTQPIKENSISEKNYFKCHICNEEFSHYDLESHYTSNHTENVKEENKSYKCQLCDSIFKNSTTLRVHQRRLHFNQTTYLCNICKNEFTAKESLKRHIGMIHDKIRVKCTNRIFHESPLKSYLILVHLMLC